MNIKTWFIRFEGDADDKSLMRHVSRSRTKSHDTVQVVEVVRYLDVKPLLEAASKHLRDPGDSHSFEILRSRLSYWKEIMLGLHEKEL